jgi:CheY-like chemotaxis protein/ketosteroid isomerase-like protein
MRILVAEDETIIRLDLKDMLTRAGFDVCAEARDGVEAVALARSEEPDLAIMDVKMPKVDGIEAARRILDERPIPIVMLTAYGQDEIVSRAIEAGVFGYLVKPFREQDLLPAIQTARARAGCVRTPAQGKPGVRPPAEGDRRGCRRHTRGRVTAEHPNAGLTRRLFAAFGRDPKVIAAALARDIVWRVPGDTVMSGEYRGTREVVEFLRRTGTETDGTYRSRLHTVLADDEWGVAIYRAMGRRNGIELDVEQALVIRFADGELKEVTAVPLDSTFDAFWG